jgi:hypothetical protein
VVLLELPGREAQVVRQVFHIHRGIHSRPSI